MATNERRRERYASDETYRERKIRAARERREQERKARERLKRLRGWKPIATVPDNEVVLIYDPDIFWPIVARIKDQRWDCIHYQGPQPHPIYWRYMIEVPLG